jgi:hypothetical protein
LGYRHRSFVLLLVASTIAPLTTLDFALSAEECRTSPGATGPSGSHWLYRINRTDHRRCWFLSSNLDRIQSHAVRRSRADATMEKPQPVKQPTVIGDDPETSNIRDQSALAVAHPWDVQFRRHEPEYARIGGVKTRISRSTSKPPSVDGTIQVMTGGRAFAKLENTGSFEGPHPHFGLLDKRDAFAGQRLSFVLVRFTLEGTIGFNTSAGDRPMIRPDRRQVCA